MSLDPLNGATNSGYTFNKDNPFAYTDPTGLYFNDLQQGGAEGYDVGPGPADTASAGESTAAKSEPAPCGGGVCLGNGHYELPNGDWEEPSLSCAEDSLMCPLEAVPPPSDPAAEIKAAEEARVYLNDPTRVPEDGNVSPQATRPSVVYRGIAKGEYPTEGFTARSPGAGNSPISHVAGQIESQWISTTWSRAIAEQRFGQFGVAEVDLSQVPSDVIDVSNGIPGYPNSYMLSRWAIANQEVLIEGSIPSEAVVNFFPPEAP